jgi:hypothetical protein
MTASWAVMTQALRASPATADPSNEEYWRMVGRQLCGRTALPTRPTFVGLPRSWTGITISCATSTDPSFQNRAKYDALAERAREKAAKLHVTADDCAHAQYQRGSNIVVTASI